MENDVLKEWMQLILMIAGLGIAYWALRKWGLFILKKVAARTGSTWVTVLYEQGVFGKFFSLLPPVIVYTLLSFFDWKYEFVIYRVVDIWLVVVCLMIIVSLLDSVNRIYESYPVSKDRPLTFFIQLIKVFLYSVTVIIIVSILVNKSPMHLIVGLGAFAAVVLLIFKDSILGFVAGIQLTANNMIRIGDWIQMDKNHADGTVMEVNLYTVKVQNWDMTISTIPTYQLVSDSFTNWRGMEESDGRRIMRSINIDMHSVRFLSREELQKYASSQFLKDYIGGMLRHLDDINKNKQTVLDERQLTNIGLFRSYMEAWLEANPEINTDMTHKIGRAHV